MSVKQILENLKYFVGTVLKNAYFDNDWDRDAIKNAMSWAKYCEKLYGQAKGKPIEEQFNNYLKTLASEPTSVVQNANFDFLQSATEALSMALLQNPYLSRELVAIVIKEYQADDASKEKLLGLVQLKSSFLALEKWSEFKTSEQEECSLHQLITSEIALVALRNRFLESEDKSKREMVINSFFSQMTKSPEQLIPLTHILCMPSTNGSDISTMQTMLMHALLCKLSEEKLEYDQGISGIHVIWNLKPDLLSKVSSLYSPFCKKYCEYLVACGQQLQMCYSATGVKWEPRDDKKEAIIYNELVCRFVSLGTESEKTRRYVIKTLRDLASSSICSVWEDILTKLQK